MFRLGLIKKEIFHQRLHESDQSAYIYIGDMGACLKQNPVNISEGGGYVLCCTNIKEASVTETINSEGENKLER